MNNKKTHQSFLWVLTIWSVSTALTILCKYYEITLIPKLNILGTQSLYIVIWLPSLVVLGKYVYTWNGEKRSLWVLLLLLFAIFGGCLYQLLFPFVTPVSEVCYSTSREGLKVKYECVCKTKYLESPYEFSYDDCQLSGFMFSPLAQRSALPSKRYGQLTIGVDNQADFPKYDWLGKPFDNEYSSRLLIDKPGYIQIGYINFSFVKKTDTFNISLIADLECSKYYTNPISFKNGENLSVRLCEKEYIFKFMNSDDFIITLSN